MLIVLGPACGCHRGRVEQLGQRLYSAKAKNVYYLGLYKSLPIYVKFASVSSNVLLPGICYVKFASVSLNVLLPGIILPHIRTPALAFCLALTSVSCSPILFNCNLPI